MAQSRRVLHQNLVYQNQNQFDEGDEFSLQEEHNTDESSIHCRKLPTLTHLKLCMMNSYQFPNSFLDISPKPDLRNSLASR